MEYPHPNPFEAGHVRAPGFDYYDRYATVFSQVTTYRSGDFPEIHQPFVYEDRSRWPTKEMPLRPPAWGERHEDAVPVVVA